MTLTTLQAANCLEVIELMRGQTPFTASRAPRDYMTEVLSGIEGGPTQPLPEDAAAAAAEFLTRLIAEMGYPEEPSAVDRINVRRPSMSPVLPISPIPPTGTP